MHLFQNILRHGQHQNLNVVLSNRISLNIEQTWTNCTTSYHEPLAPLKDLVYMLVFLVLVYHAATWIPYNQSSSKLAAAWLTIILIEKDAQT